MHGSFTRTLAIRMGTANYFVCATAPDGAAMRCVTRASGSKMPLVLSRSVLMGWSSRTRVPFQVRGTSSLTEVHLTVGTTVVGKASAGGSRCVTNAWVSLLHCFAQSK